MISLRFKLDAILYDWVLSICDHPQQAFLSTKNKGKKIVWLFQEEKDLREISSFYNQIDST